MLNGMKWKRKFISVRRKTLNETDIMENQMDTEQDLSSSETPDIEESGELEESEVADGTETSGTDAVQTSESEQEKTEEPKETEESEKTEETDSTNETSDISALVEQTTAINQKLDTISNTLIVSMVGLALVIGILACNIFSRYFKA